MEMFSTGEQSKSKSKFGGKKACEGYEVTEYFINPKIGNETFGQCVTSVWISQVFHASLVKIYCQK